MAAILGRLLGSIMVPPDGAAIMRKKTCGAQALRRHAAAASLAARIAVWRTCCMLNFSEVTLRRGPRVLFADASFGLFRGEKVGITGENGSGKSSLLALVRGDLHPDSGSFEAPAGLALAHVSQELAAT